MVFGNEQHFGFLEEFVHVNDMELVLFQRVGQYLTDFGCVCLPFLSQTNKAKHCF